MSLFRHEVLELRRSERFGKIVLVRPISLTLITILAVSITAVTAGFLLYGEYTKKARISGFLTPRDGLIKVNVAQSGTVIERRVSDGQAVNRGDILFVVSYDHGTAEHPQAQAAITQQLAVRRQSLLDDLEKQRSMGAQREAQTQRRLVLLRGEIAQLQVERDTQMHRTRSAESAFRRFEELRARGFVSDLQLQQKDDDLLDQQAKLQATDRGRLSMLRDLAALEAEARDLPMRTARDITATQREIASTEQQLTESETRRQGIVTAPEPGVVTAILAERGQTVSPAMPLLSIVPSGSILEAQLYAPSRAVGFVKPGQHVLLKYQAYPFQKFGQYDGTVMAVSRTALQPNEVPTQAMAPPSTPMYRINVALRSPTVMAYGKEEPLQAGMQLDADIELERRGLLEWVFEPLISLRGQV
ncbi:MAG: HlyD family secretion protein [Usitatibacter sp.]